MRRRQWVREGDLIIVWPGFPRFQRRSTVTRRHRPCTSLEKGVLPDDVDMFGMGVPWTTTANMTTCLLPVLLRMNPRPAMTDGLFADDDGDDDLFADDDEDDDLFAEDEPKGHHRSCARRGSACSG